jgi:hypothetical protein
VVENQSDDQREDHLERRADQGVIAGDQQGLAEGGIVGEDGEQIFKTRPDGRILNVVPAEGIIKG